MVRAILEGRKTQTRRVISDDWWRCLDPEDVDDREAAIGMCPYGVPGDKLWVRETWGGEAVETSVPVAYRADFEPGEYNWRHREQQALFVGKWRPSIFMPRHH